MLALAAGGVNSAAFFACQRFVTHVTGTITRLGVDIKLWPLVADSGLILLCFIAGAGASVIALDGRRLANKKPLYALPLLVVAGLLILVAALGYAGLFGPFGGAADDLADLVFLSMLSFAMGLQNASVATATGLTVRTTHLTGPATDLGVHLGMAFLAKDDLRRKALHDAALRGTKILGFVAGAALMVPVAEVTEYLSFLIPAALVVIATALSFVPSWAGLLQHGPQQAQSTP